MEMSATLFGISSLAKIDFYLIRVKFIRMLCNMFKQIQLIISFLQEFFNGFIQIFNILHHGHLIHYYDLPKIPKAD